MMKKALLLMALALIAGSSRSETCEVQLVNRSVNRLALRFHDLRSWDRCGAIMNQCVATGYYNRMNYACVLVPFREAWMQPFTNYILDPRDSRVMFDARRLQEAAPVPAATPSVPTPSTTGGMPGSGSGTGTISTPATPPGESRRAIVEGETVYFQSKNYIVDEVLSNGELKLRSMSGRGGSLVEAKRADVAITRGCAGDVCVYDSVLDLTNRKHVAIAGITWNGKLLARSSDDGATLSYELNRENLAVTKGCAQSGVEKICVGNIVIAANRAYYRVVGIQAASTVTLESSDSKDLRQNVPAKGLVVVQ